MKTDPLRNPQSDSPVRPLGASSLKSEGPSGTRYVAPAIASKDSVTIILITFDASGYPLEEHCCYAARANENVPYIFPNFDFRRQPPGIRVGPWPGWRGIPLMPLATLEAGETTTALQFQFWGDELDQHTLRAVAKIDFLSSKQIIVNAADKRLVPLKAEFFTLCARKPEPLVFDIGAGALSRHPRLLINEGDLRPLRNKVDSQHDLIRRIHDFIPQWEQSLTVTPESKIPSGPESLTPEDRVLIGALLGLLEPEAHSVRGINSLLDYCTLTEQPGFAPLTIDTQSGETLFLLCVGYDWLFPHLNTEQEQRVRNRLWEIADVCWNHLGYERDDYAQAHYIGCGLGLLAFSLLFWDTHPRAREWGQHLAGVLIHVLSVLPADGFFPHGVNLWIYEFGFLLRWLELLHSGGGPDLWPKNSALSNASAFRAAATSPDGLYGITFGDPQFRVGGDTWCHYLIAARTGSRTARWLGDHLRDLPIEGVDFRHAPARRRVYEFLWFPERVEPHQAPDGISVFPDGGQVFARSSDSLLTFRSGPPLGSHRYQSGIMGGYGHSDPCNGSFLLYQNGLQMITGPGPVYRRDTSLQNCITIEGKGQIGDSTVWMPDFIPPFFHAPVAETRTADNVLAVSVDLATAYLPNLGVNMHRRSLLAEPGRFVLGADIVTLAAAASIEWNLHSGGDFVQVEEGRLLRFSIAAENNEWFLLIFTSSGKVTSETALSQFVPAYPNSGVRDRFLRIACRTDRAVFHWCLCRSDNMPVPQLQNENRASWVFPDGVAADFDGTWISMSRTS
ncbi:MAG: heparinase II/III family protein [Bacteroidota bacterium]